MSHNTMAIVTKLRSCFLVVLFVTFGNSLNVLASSHILNKRQFPSARGCIMEIIVCSEKPFLYCDSGVCLEVHVIEQTGASPLCQPMCAPLLETTTPTFNKTDPVAMSTNRTEVTNRNTINATNVTPLGGSNVNVTNDTAVDVTNGTTLAYPINQTDDGILNWKDDPAYCDINFVCRNGGYCSPDYRNKTSEYPSARCICPEHWIGDFCQRNCSLQCENNGTCILVGEVPYCNCLTGYDPPDCQPRSITTTTTYPSNQTDDGVLNWKDDPAYCAFNFVCSNGGYCSPEYRNKTSEQPSARCICPEHWVGDFCDRNCSLECENNGTCILVGDDPYCNCLPGYDPPDCQPIQITATVKPPPPTQMTWFVPVLSVCSILLVVLLTYVILTKLRWKSTVITKVFHYFQPYEDDDGRLFDAFISYRSSNQDYSQSEDEKFVCKVLQPILEKEFAYKVCVHYRDFPPGETITNNIMWAVENSRRTILVLSPLYVESEWARLEYQKAQQEMLQLRHKIIPIILEDISNDEIEDGTLNDILSSVTYIKYPKDSDAKHTKKFWSMLQLALPKKRTTDALAVVSLTPKTSTSTSAESVSEETASGSSQESLRSTRTDVTDVSDVVVEPQAYRQNVLEDVVIANINEVDKVAGKRGHKNKKLKNKRIKISTNAETYINVLEMEK